MSVIFDPPTPQQRRSEPRETGRTVLGLCILLLGALVCIGVLVVACLLIFGPDNLYLLRKFTPQEFENLDIVLPQGEVQLPRRVVAVTGYGILLALLLMATFIGMAMLKAGTTLLRLAELTAEFRRTRA